ncbi:hypothetical protein PFISCL1PPCAC_23819, partial [Pristionchus fissidentatus]
MGESSSLNYLVFPCIAVILALVVDAVKKKTNLPLPESVLLFLTAVTGSFFLHAFLNAQEREKIREEFLWLDMAPDAILGILLPPLLFESAYKTNMSFFLFRLKMIVTLCASVYILTAILVTAVYIPIFTIISGWHHFVAAILACILVATDPVAVVAILESMGAPLRLKILIEGESLLNDGLAIFGFKFFLRLFIQELGLEEAENEGSLLDTMTYLTRCIVISPVVGILLGHVSLWIMSHVEETKRKQCTLLLCVYISYQLCEGVGSGALGLVCMGLAISHLKEQLSAETEHIAHEFWSILGYIANAVIFVFAGVAVASELFSNDSIQAGKHRSIDPMEDSLEETSLQDNILACLCGFCLAPITMLARSIGVYLIFVTMAKVQQTHRKPLASDYALLSFGGLRGALGLILAMEFRNEMREQREDSELVAFGRQMLIVTCLSTFFSLVLQGSLFGPFALAEEQTKRSAYADESKKTIYAYMKRKARELVESRMEKTDYLVGTSWNTVLSQTNVVFRDKSVSFLEERESRSIYCLGVLEKPYEKDQVLDVRSCFYHCLLARVHGAWEQGAISAPTAHVIIRIIEHGLDEGGLEMGDFTEHLSSIDASSKMIWFSSILHRFHLYLSSFPFFKCFLLPSTRKSPSDSAKKAVEIQIDRSQEKWFLFVAVLSIFHTYMVVIMFLAGGTHDSQLRFLFLALLMAFFVIFEKLLYIYHLSAHSPTMPTQKKASEGQSAYNRRVDMVKEQRRK